MNQYQSQGKLLTNFHDRWSIHISLENKAKRQGIQLLPLELVWTNGSQIVLKVLI